MNTAITAQYSILKEASLTNRLANQALLMFSMDNGTSHGQKCLHNDGHDPNHRNKSVKPGQGEKRFAV